MLLMGDNSVLPPPTYSPPVLRSAVPLSTLLLLTLCVCVCVQSLQVPESV